MSIAAGYVWAGEASRLSLVATEQKNQAASLARFFADAFVIGAAIPGAKINPEERKLLFTHFGAVTPENCMKPAKLHPSEDRFAFDKADALVAMARTNNLTINGHTLLWHQECPEWFFKNGDQDATREQVLARMRSHISAVVGHFAGKVKSWDVVNEAISDDTGYLRESQWLSLAGEDFIAEAFFAARKADPQAELYYNDYAIEKQPKRGKALRLIRDLKKRGAPLQGIGIQGHWQLDNIPFQDIEDAILAFHAEGLTVMITELDIDMVPRITTGAETTAQEQTGADPFSQGLPPEVQKRLADQYAQLFALFLKHRDKISRITFWGLHDGRSWLNKWPSKRTNHPLLWDRALQPKPALSAVMSLTQADGAASFKKPPSDKPLIPLQNKVRHDH